jgi:predicted DNA-binding protein YlxM (UPF0122 family)
MRTSKQDKDKMVEMYLSKEYDTKQMATIYGISSNAVVTLLKRRGVVLERFNYKKKYNNVVLNNDFFANPNTEKSAYYAGFIAADGCIHQGKMENSQPVLSIEIHTKDVKVLEQFDVGTEISFRTNREMCKKSISSTKICKDLETYGIVQNKTFLLSFPTNINQENLHHYIRGVFDGDGWFTINKNGLLRSGICGCYEFLVELQNHIPCKSVVRIPKGKRYGVMEIYHKENEAFGNFIYKDSTLFLDRKQQIFRSVFTTQPSKESLGQEQLL